MLFERIISSKYEVLIKYGHFPTVWTIATLSGGMQKPDSTITDCELE